MKQILPLIILVGVGVGVFIFLGRKPTKYDIRKPTKYDIGEYINYCGINYLVRNNRESDSYGNLVYQLQNVETQIAYWFKVSYVDANICVA